MALTRLVSGQCHKIWGKSGGRSGKWWVVDGARVNAIDLYSIFYAAIN